MLRELLSRWPVVKQIKTGGDGTGPEAMSDRTSILVRAPRALKWRVLSALIAAWAAAN